MNFILQKNTVVLSMIFFFISFISNAQTVTPWITSGNKSMLLQQQPTGSLGENTSPASGPVNNLSDNGWIRVFPNRRKC